MKVAILHYHLNPGGVSRIIESQVKGLTNASVNLEIEVMCGHDGRTADLGGTIPTVDGSLFYNNAEQPDVDYKTEIIKIIDFIKMHLSGNTILHCHNPNLGKNPALTMAIFELAKEGFSIVNHYHDFSEDRPINHAFLERIISDNFGMDLNEVLYPDFPRYHYIVLNPCDYNRILQQHIPAYRIHLLHNPVYIHNTVQVFDKGKLRKAICSALDLDETKKICTYPVRVIERKNLGEFLLLAALFASQANFAVTQPPKNPLEIPRYSGWKEFCRITGLKVKFEAGEVVNHEELIRVSDFCITTSIREGFGMVYLEPWLAGTPVIGRDLPCITGDLKKYGIEFPRLYKSIMVETQAGIIDFKDLELELQENYITSVHKQQAERHKLFQANPFLNTFLMDIPVEITRNNQQIINDHFTVEKYGERLLAIYNRISG
jgi:glycosyltransferase involved in cell wall biosynthesis